MARSENNPDRLAERLERAESCNRAKAADLLGRLQLAPADQGPSGLGIMGGTFDPVHYGHLVAANTACWEYNLVGVVFVPSGRPPHKRGKVITEQEHRYRMALLATCDNSQFFVSRLEMDRPGYSYAIDTVKNFAAVLGPRQPLYFITGADAVIEILAWKNINEFFTYCSFIAVTRPGFDLGGITVEPQLNPIYLDNIECLEIPALAISSTDIRQRIAQGRPVRYLLPDAVHDYIANSQVYAPAGTAASEAGFEY